MDTPDLLCSPHEADVRFYASLIDIKLSRVLTRPVRRRSLVGLLIRASPLWIAAPIECGPCNATGGAQAICHDKTTVDFCSEPECLGRIGRTWRLCIHRTVLFNRATSPARGRGRRGMLRACRKLHGRHFRTSERRNRCPRMFAVRAWHGYSASRTSTPAESLLHPPSPTQVSDSCGRGKIHLLVSRMSVLRSTKPTPRHTRS